MEKKRKGAGRQIPGTTQDEQLLESPRPDEFTHTDPWRVFRIMGEFVEGFDELATLSRGIAIFGSVRLKPVGSRSAATSNCRSSRDQIPTKRSVSRSNTSSCAR